MERKGSIVLESSVILLVANAPAAVMNVLVTPVKVGIFNALTSSHEMRPLSVQHWSISTLHATLLLSLSGRVRMVMGCRFSF